VLQTHYICISFAARLAVAALDLQVVDWVAIDGGFK